MRFLVLVVTLLLAAACAPPVSRQALNLVEPGITFEEVAREPDRHAGRYLLLGGTIASVRSVNSAGSELEVVQLPTNDRGRITDTSRSAGRFLVRDDTFRDPAIYHPGRLITVVGQVVGSQTGRIGEMDYLYPVLTVHELRLWAPGEHPDASRVRFGIGIGIGISR
jgi:outer membrane lipoprotein